MAKKTATNPKELRANVQGLQTRIRPAQPSYDGHMILCRCPFWEYSKFLTRDICDKFSKK